MTVRLSLVNYTSKGTINLRACASAGSLLFAACLDFFDMGSLSLIYFQHPTRCVCESTPRRKYLPLRFHSSALSTLTTCCLVFPQTGMPMILQPRTSSHDTLLEKISLWAGCCWRYHTNFLPPNAPQGLGTWERPAQLKTWWSAPSELMWWAPTPQTQWCIELACSASESSLWDSIYARLFCWRNVTLLPIASTEQILLLEVVYTRAAIYDLPGWMAGPTKQWLIRLSKQPPCSDIKTKSSSSTQHRSI